MKHTLATKCPNCGKNGILHFDSESMANATACQMCGTVIERKEWDIYLEFLKDPKK